ncbi:MAG: D-alanyl-D-alanine carboxypeptidase family protein [Acidimicrobiales bacterium]
MRWARLAVAAVAVVLLAPPLAASADARSEQAEVQAKKVEAAARLDVLKASDREVEEALAALDTSVVGTTDQLTEAAQAERRAALEAESADRQLAAGEERLRGAMGELRGQALNAYTTPAPGVLELSSSVTAGEVSRSMVYADVRMGRSTDTLDKVRAARSDLAVAKRRAEKAAKEAAGLRATSAAHLAELEKLRATQGSVAESLEAKLAASEAEVDQLAATDAQLADAIARQDVEAAARRRAELLAQQAAEAERATRLRAAAAAAAAAAAPPPPPVVPRANATVSVSPGIRPLPSRPVTPAPAPPRPGPPRPVPSAPAGPGLTTVRGITVSSSIAGQLSNLLSASDSAGLSLSGGGYRSSQQQIQTRMNNCGTSNYAIYEMPASQCSPPTAKPGASMHERGLAIDFQNRGSLITSRSNPAFQWLAGNAGRFGFRNLPSEPWHWSTTGS